MSQTKLFKFTSVLLFLIFILYFLELKFYLSWTVWWYDILLHFLGGSVVGMAVLLIFERFFDMEITGVFKTVLIGIVGAFVIGVLWEILELRLNLTSFSDGVVYITDTISDLILDMTGAFFGIFYGLKIWKKN